jgi:mannose-6-phosphate isomerase-like protein (cupin superfamily)
MHAFELADLLAERSLKGTLYLEFLHVFDLSAGVYVLPAGGADPQQPHTEDEVYYVVRGRGAITVAGESRPVQAGSVVYVPARSEHHFHTIEEELVLLVFFAPAEDARGATGERAD